MATASLNLNVTAPGMNGLVAQSAQFNNNMQAGANAAKTAGGTAGSRMLAATAAPKTNTGISKEELTAYNLARGVGSGSTGSGTSDFARQAQGLGGLVHVYATFAANLFAAEAAFRALSNAMDTSNLVKGLDQIGASSGRNLGSLAKQMVAVTNGAISLQQAMTSTAMASSGGMTNEAIIRMTEVAKKASLALGRDMADSMDRLTKGIIKTQPELLDELGIMTRVIPAQQAYAQQIGKTASSLTEFEKRQAFANAVLTEGEKKFGSINLDTNPYSKILASMQNLAQTGLELVNKALGPIANILASSPTGLATAMAGIAGILLKQAIPAIGMFRENAIAMAEEATIIANKRNKAAKEAALGQVEQVKASAMVAAAAEQKILTDNLAKLQAIKDSSTMSTKSKSYAILQKDPMRVTEEDLAHLDREADKLEKRNAVAARGYREAIENIVLTRNAQNDLNEAIAEHTKAQQAASGYFSTLSQQQRIADKANQEATTRRIASVWAENTQTQGFFKSTIQGWKDLAKAREDSTRTVTTTTGKGKDKVTTTEVIDVKGINTYQAATSGIKETVKSAASSVMTLASSLSNVFMVAGVAAAAFGILDSFMTTSAKEAEAFGTSMDTLSSSLENVSRTIDIINKKDLTDFLSVESTQAKANALNDLSGSLSSTISKFEKLQSAQGGWDRFFDGFWDMFGKGSADKLAAGISNTVVSAFTAMEEGPTKDAAKSAIENIIGQKVDISNFKEINALIKDLDADTIVSKGKQIDAAIKSAAREAGNAAASLTAFKTALVDVAKQSTTMTNNLLPTDDFSKLGIEVGKAAKAMGDALKTGPVNGLIALKELASDTRTLSLLPPSTVKDLANAKKELNDISLSLADARKNQVEAEAKIAAARETIKKQGRGTYEGNQARIIIEEETLRRGLAMQREAAALDNAKKVQEQFAAIPQMLSKVSYDNLAAGLNKALSEASVSAAKGYLDVIKGAGGSTAEADARLTAKSIDIQIQDIKAKYVLSEKMQDLIVSNQISDAVTEKASLVISKALLERQGGNTADITTKIAALDKDIEKFNEARKIMASGSRAIVGLSKTAAGEGEGATKAADLLKSMGSLATEAFGKESALAKLFSEKGTAELQAKVGKLVDAKNLQMQTLELEGKQSSRNLEAINQAIALNGQYSESLQTAKEREDRAILLNKYKKEELETNTKIASLALLFSQAGVTEDAKGKARTQIANLAKSASESEEKKKQDIYTSDMKALSDRIAGENSLRKLKLDKLDLERKENTAINEAKASAADVELTYLREVGSITQETYLIEKKSLDLNKQKNDFLGVTADLSRKYEDEKKTLEDAKRVKTASATALGTTADTSLEDTKLKDLEASYNRQVIAINIQNEAKKRGIELTAAQAVILAQQADAMQKMDTFAQSLTDAFGEMGTAIGATAKAFLKFAQDQEKLNEQKEAAGTDRVKLDKYERDSIKLQIAGIASISGASKKMFSEKSLGYKVLGDIEKAANIASVAAQAKDLALAANTALTKIGINIPAIYSSFMAAMGPWGPPAAAAAIATFIGAMSGDNGGGGEYTGPMPMYATGSATNSAGVSSGTGVGGDLTAQNTALIDSLNILTELAKPEFNLTSKMQRSLASIDDSMTNFLIAVAPTMGVSSSAAQLAVGPVNSAGTPINKLVATGAGALGGGALAAQAALALGTGGLTAVAATIAGAVVGTQQIQNAVNAISGLLGGDGMSMSGGTTVSAYGLEIKKQTLATAALGTVVNNFTDTWTEIQHDGPWGYKSYKESHPGPSFSEAADATVKAALTNISANILYTYTEVAKGLKLDPKIVAEQELNIARLNKMGLKADEYAKLVGAEFGKFTDQIATALIPNISDFQQKSESVGTTIIRLASSMEEAQFYTDKLGLSVVKYNDIVNKKGDLASEAVRQSILMEESSKRFRMVTKEFDIFGYRRIFTYMEVTDALSNIGLIIKNFSGSAAELADLYVKLVDIKTTFVALGISADSVNTSLLRGAGGIDSLAQSLSEFTSGFLTEAEQKSIKQAKMDSEFKKLGLTTPATAEGFKDLVLKLRDGGEATSELLGRVLLLSSGMKDLTGGIKEVLSVTQIQSAQQDQAVTIYNLLGDSERALAITRNKELAGLDKSLISNQKYIYALQNEATLRTKLVTAYNDQKNAINATITSLKSSIKTLADYRKTLTGGANALLTPTQKYTETKGTLEELKSIITGPALTTEQQTARADAISKLPAASDAFLQASQAIYASSDQYAADYQSVLSFVDSTSALLTSQQSDAEKQLQVLTDSYTALKIISDATVSTATLLEKYIAAQQETAIAKASATIIDPFAKPVSIEVSIQSILDSVATSFKNMFKGFGFFADGGYASGLSIVGESGPELVDFKSPGRVYTAQETFGMFNGSSNNAATINELRALREEIKQLREQQRTETGHLITAAYDSQNQNAAAVTDAVTTTSANQLWANKVQNAAKLG